MKIIDKTPFQDDKGDISFIGRIQGTLKYGFSWYAEMEAQKAVVAQLNHSLEKSFILIRNFNLPGSNIIIPIILIGVGGIHVIHPTPARGHFEAKGDQWNTIDNSGNSQPARVNLLDKAVKLTRAFQKYLEINKIKITAPIEPVFIAVDPGAHIESMRPVIKVVKSDVIKVFIASLLQSPPIWRTDYIYELADRISEPRLREDLKPEAEPAAPVSQPVDSFDASDLRDGFANDPIMEQQPARKEKPVPQSRQRFAPRSSKKILGMTRTQFMVVAGMLMLFCCIFAVAAYYFSQYPLPL